MSKRIPNCNICKWVRQQICAAQGGRFKRDVYNNKMCRKLFSEFRIGTESLLFARLGEEARDTIEIGDKAPRYEISPGGIKRRI